jgi:hypothetical protein
MALRSLDLLVAFFAIIASCCMIIVGMQQNTTISYSSKAFLAFTMQLTWALNWNGQTLTSFITGQEKRILSLQAHNTAP